MSDTDGILLKLKWAQEHLDLFNVEVIDFLKNNPCGHDSRLQPIGDREYDVIVTASITNLPPPKLSIIIGDILYQIRSVLDHLIYQLGIIHNPNCKWLEQSEFPIFIERDKFFGKSPKSGLNKIRCISPEAQTIIEKLQPYHSGDRATIHPLWILQRLCNIDKHRRLCLIGAPLGLISFGDGTFIVKEWTIGAIRPLKDGTEIMRIRIKALPNFHGKVRVNQKIPPQIAFEETIPIQNLYVGEIIENILAFVEDSVIPRFERFLVQ